MPWWRRSSTRRARPDAAGSLLPHERGGSAHPWPRPHPIRSSGLRTPADASPAGRSIGSSRASGLPWEMTRISSPASARLSSSESRSFSSRTGICIALPERGIGSRNVASMSPCYARSACRRLHHHPGCAPMAVGFRSPWPAEHCRKSRQLLRGGGLLSRRHQFDSSPVKRDRFRAFLSLMAEVTEWRRPEEDGQAVEAVAA